MNKNSSIRELVSLVKEANQITESTADWDVKYDLIFGLGIHQVIKEVGLNFSYYDPDTSYREDVQAFIRALNEFMESLGNLSN